MKRVMEAIITCYNEEKNIKDCIESVLWCDSILVIDSFSTDRTLSIAVGYPKVKILQRKYYGSASQKNWAIKKSNSEWMFVLDADERCTPELKREIIDVVRKGEHSVLSIRRKTYFLDKELKYSGWQDDRVTRVLKKGAGRCPKLRVHGGIEPFHPPYSLKEPLLHYMVRDVKEYKHRLDKYGYWGASQLYVDGKSNGLFNVAIHSAWRFFRTYFLQLGFLDGITGIRFCYLQSYGTYKKYALHLSWIRAERKGIIPILAEFDKDPETWGDEGGIQVPVPG